LEQLLLSGPLAAGYIQFRLCPFEGCFGRHHVCLGLMHSSCEHLAVETSQYLSGTYLVAALGKDFNDPGLGRRYERDCFPLHCCRSTGNVSG
jgi:hypothetical protein